MKDCLSLFDEIAELVGLPAATALSRRWGGTAIYIPHRPGANAPLVAVVGPDVAALLAQRYGGGMLRVPNTPGKHARVWELRRQGASITAIALATGYTDRNIYYILAGPEPALDPDLPPLLAIMIKV